MAITRRDFLNGIALAVGTSLSPLATYGTALAEDYYPPLLTGLRGHHPGSFETAHAMGREGESFNGEGLAVLENYDLVIVGAGISGLSAAWFYREKNPDASILLLDNHDDFGGHAKRNEFKVAGRTILSYGGSESFQSPKALFGTETLHLMKGLGIKINRFENAFDRNFYSDLGLSRGVYFDSEHFATAKLVTGDPQPLVADDLNDETRNARSWADFIADFPLSETDRKALLSLHLAPADYLSGKTTAEKVEILSKTSYDAFLKSYVKLSDTAVQYFRNRSCDFTAFCIDAFPAYDAYLIGYPGFGGMNLPPPDASSVAELQEPYIYHFPDGNAGLARMLTRSLIPAVATGDTMDDIVDAQFDYTMLDIPSNKVRIRLSSTAVDVRNVPDAVEVTYEHFGTLTKVKARHCILAGFNMLVPYIFKEISESQAEALRRNVKLPLVYTKVLVANWEAFVRAGVHEIYCPTRPYSRIKLDYPVDLGSYRFPRNPAEPACIHMVYTPAPYGEGLDDGRDLARLGRIKLLDMSFEDHESLIQQQLSEILTPYGFNVERDILAITVNRWSHGYSWSLNTLFDEDESAGEIIQLARQRVGNVSIANSDADWAPYVPGAVSQAWRAVVELTN